jgi:hypothetical protein
VLESSFSSCGHLGDQCGLFYCKLQDFGNRASLKKYSVSPYSIVCRDRIFFRIGKIGGIAVSCVRIWIRIGISGGLL